MADADDLLWHRSGVISGLVVAHHRLALQAAQQAGDEPPATTSVLLVADPGPEGDAIARGLPEHAAVLTATGPADVPARRFDVVVLASAPDGDLVEALAGAKAPDGLLVVSLPAGPPAVDVIAALRARFANVMELGQVPAPSSVLIDLTGAPSYPQLLSWSGDEEPPTPGAVHVHSLLVAADISLDHHRVSSVLSRSPAPEPPPTAGPARRVAGAVKRRLRPPGAGAQITVPSHPAPLVSIIVPVHGKWPITEQCLASLEELGMEATAEVIVVDDASPDDTRTQLDRVRGARVVSLTENVGFLRACNAGIAEARGQLVLFLNNDAIPQAGSIDHLVARMQSDPAIGVVGAKLVYLDRSLQEAGGLVWANGDGWNLGRGDDPASPEFSYPIDVDYCSGAALLVRRSLLDATGGFDERYSPAYYEDTDLCFEARARGLRVVMEPKARVVHMEGQSHGTSTASGIKRFQEVNREKFREKWADELQHHLPPMPQFVPLAKSRLARRRVLVVDHTIPTYDRDGGSLRMLRLLRTLRELGCFIWFVPADRLLLQPYTQALLDLGVEVVGPRQDLRSLVRQLGPGLDVALVSRRGVAWGFVDMLRDTAPSAKLVFDTVDLHFVREEAEASRSGDPVSSAAAARGRRMEIALVGVADQTWVVSSDEQRLLQQQVPGADIRLIPNVHDAEPTGAPFADRRDLLFVGNFRHTPNVDAVDWTAREILPLVRAKLPGVRLHIVGDHLPASLRSTLDDSCVVHGWVEHLAPVYEGARIVLAPLRYGAGMKGKVAEALGMGVPVVTTPTGGEGMPDSVRDLLLESSSPEELARLVVELYEDEDRWTAIHRGAPAAIDAAYGEPAVRELVRQALDDLAG